MTDWTAVLDGFEESLDRHWDALRAGAPETVAPFTPPAVTSPLPAEHVARATSLVWRFRELEDAIADRLAAAGESLQRLERPAPAAPAEPVYFDSRV